MINNGYCHYCSEKNDLLPMILHCKYNDNQRKKLLAELNNKIIKSLKFFEILNNLNEHKTRKIVAMIHITASKNHM